LYTNEQAGDSIMKIEATFEETLVHYPFAPLVVMVIAAVKRAQVSKPESSAGSDGVLQTPAGVAS
jgi:hypothetical protein